MISCHIDGDSIAEALASVMKECKSDAIIGIPAQTIIHHVHDADLTIISAGSNDPHNAGLQSFLERCRAVPQHRVMWIVPHDPTAAAKVRAVAAAHGDGLIIIPFYAADGVHPKYLGPLATQARTEIRLLGK